jgi:hypothetical protein
MCQLTEIIADAHMRLAYAQRGVCGSQPPSPPSDHRRSSCTRKWLIKTVKNLHG